MNTQEIINATDFDFTEKDVTFLQTIFNEKTESLKDNHNFSSSSLEVMGSVDGDYIVMFFYLNAQGGEIREDIEVRKNDRGLLSFTYSSSYYNECVKKEHYHTAFEALEQVLDSIEADKEVAHERYLQDLEESEED